METNLYEMTVMGLEEALKLLPEILLGGMGPAFLIAGAIRVFISKERVTKYIGSEAPVYISYPIAAITGTMFTACACGVLPLFASIYRSGAGIGPAFTFLVSGPAINLLAIALTYQFFGFKMGTARAAVAILGSVLIGLIFAWIYRDEDCCLTDEDVKALKKKKKKKNKESDFVEIEFTGKSQDRLTSDLTSDEKCEATSLSETLQYGERKKEKKKDNFADEMPASHVILIFAVMLALMVNGLLTGITLKQRLLGHGLLLFILAIVFLKFVKPEARLEWFRKVIHFFGKVFWPLLIGLFLVGFLKKVTPPSFILQHVGSNTLYSNFISSLIGSMMYFGTCVSVVIVRGLKELGMAQGPDLALFLSGPTVSLPSLLTLAGIIGWRKTSLLLGLVISMATLAGFFYGMW